jgi:integrase
MAKLYRRGKTWWYQYQGERISTKCTDKAAAEIAYAKAQRRSIDPTYVAADDALLKDWVTKMLAAKASGKSAGTLNMYACKAGHVLRVFGVDAFLKEVTPATVDDYVRTRAEEGASNNTIGKEITAILQICKLAKRSGEYAGDLSVLRPPGFSTGYAPRERTLSAKDEKKLRLAASPAQWAAIALILGSACRLSEAFKVTPEDLDWKGKEMRIHGTKTKSSDAMIPIIDKCGMAAYLMEAEPFLPISWEHMSKRLPDLCRKAEIEELTPNDLRRTVATRLIEAGVDAYTVAKITRHKTLIMLQQVYDRATTDATRRLIDGKPKRNGTKTVQAKKKKPGSVRDSEAS